MDAEQFTVSLSQAGYKDIASKSMEPRPANGDHAHEYAVRGLVTAGEFIIACNGGPAATRPARSSRSQWAKCTLRPLAQRARA